MAGPAPRYGPNAKRVAVSFWNRVPATCDPAVGIACDVLSGFAFNQVTRPVRLPAGMAFFARIRNGLLESSATGSKSFTTSYERGKVAPFATWVSHWPTSRV